MAKITAIHSGGDWYDASAEYLILPSGMNIEAQSAAWRVWYRNVYCPALHPRSGVEFVTLVQWLKRAGAVAPSPDELEIFDDA